MLINMISQYSNKTLYIHILCYFVLWELRVSDVRRTIIIVW